MGLLPPVGFFILVVSISPQRARPSADGGPAGRAAGSPTDEGAAAGTDGAAAQGPLLGSRHAGASPHQSQGQDHNCCSFHFLPLGASAGFVLGPPKTTSITGVSSLPGLFL
jgi:hypothetical protein